MVLSPPRYSRRLSPVRQRPPSFNDDIDALMMNLVSREERVRLQERDLVKHNRTVQDREVRLVVGEERLQNKQEREKMILNGQQQRIKTAEQNLVTHNKQMAERETKITHEEQKLRRVSEREKQLLREITEREEQKAKQMNEREEAMQQREGDITAAMNAAKSHSMELEKLQELEKKLVDREVSVGQKEDHYLTNEQRLNQELERIQAEGSNLLREKETFRDTVLRREVAFRDRADELDQHGDQITTTEAKLQHQLNLATLRDEAAMKRIQFLEARLQVCFL